MVLLPGLLTLLFHVGRLTQTLFNYLFNRPRPRFGRRKARPGETVFRRHPPKPEWVQREIIRLKALMPEAGCRQITDTFNRRFAGASKTTVGKTWVSGIVRRHRYEIQVLRGKIKHARPKPVPRNLVWGLDLTGKTDAQGNLHNLLGIVEHHNRANLGLTALRDKTSLTLLRHLLDALERYGKPTYLRTDNEAVFTSTLFRLGLWLLGIRHQRIERGCPWQNGRVERFFGTLKQKLDRWEIDSLEALNQSLGQFRRWYNHVRPHRNLEGRTPAEVWAGVDVYRKKPKQEYWFEAWDGLLTGIYLRH